MRPTTRLWPLLLAFLVAACASAGRGSAGRPGVEPLEGVKTGKKQHVKEKRLVNYYDAATILKKADEFYEKEEWIEAAAEYERFMDLHRLHSQAGYALFRLGMSDRKQVSTMDRDLEPLLKSLAAFERLLAEFPDSLDAAEAKTQIASGRRLQADRQLAIGRFYYRQARYPAAITRLRRVTDQFAGLDQAAKAWYYLALSYQEAGDAREARVALTTLVAQYPTSRYREWADRALAALPGDKTVAP